MTAPKYERVQHAVPEVRMPDRGPACPAPGTLLFRGLTGSHAYGLATPTSDEDWRGVFAADTRDVLGLRDPRDTYHGEGDTTFWECRKFLNLLIKGSVNAHELLWLPEECVDHTSPFWDSLRSMRASLFSKHLYDGWMGVTRAYGYELDKRGPDWPDRAKHAMHMLRFSSGLCRALAIGMIQLRGREDYVLPLVRSGEFPAEKAIEWAQQDLHDAETMHAQVPWPDEPDVARLESMLIEHRLAQLALPC